MSWVDNRHNASEQEVADLQKLEDLKIYNSKIENGKYLSQLEKQKKLYNEIHDITVGYRTDEHVFSSYGYRTDYYFLTGEKKVKGRILKFYTLSPALEKKYIHIQFPDSPKVYLEKNVWRNLNQFYQTLNIDPTFYSYNYPAFMSSLDLPKYIYITFDKKSQLWDYQEKTFLEQEMPDEVSITLEIVGLIDNNDIIELFCIVPS